MDSGGPVLWKNPYTKKWVLVGLISYGQGCGTYEVSVNVRVPAYLEWIEQKTGY